MSGFVPEPNNNNEEVNAERFPVRAARREAALRERVMMNILERQRNNSTNNDNDNNNNNNNNNNTIYPNSEMSDALNAERFPNTVSEREAELRMKALEEIERRKDYKSGYMFNRAGSNERYVRNVMNSILKLLPKHEAIKVKEYALKEKYVDKDARNAEMKQLARQKEIQYLRMLEFRKMQERANALAEQARVVEQARLAEQARMAEQERVAREIEEARLAAENARRIAMQELLRAEALRPLPSGLRRANATIEGVPGRRPERRRTSRKLRKHNNKTRRQH